MTTEAVPNEIQNEIQNDCDMATELVPKAIENDHRAYSLRSHSDRYHCRKTAHRDRMRGLPGAQPKLWPNGILNGIPNHLTGGLPNDY